MALRANRPNTGVTNGGAHAAPQNTGAATGTVASPQYQQQNQGSAIGSTQPQYQNQTQYQQPAPGAAVGGTQPQYQTAYAPAPINNGAAPAIPSGNAVQNLNSGILENIEGMDSMGNFVTLDGSDFLYKATETRVPYIDLIVTYGKRYYQWVEESADPNVPKIFHDSQTRIDDRYKLRFEIHWEEEEEEGIVSEVQFHLPAATAMRFIDYVKELAKLGYGIGQVVTRMTISRQQQKLSTNRYSRGEFAMIGYIDANNQIVEMAGPSTVNKQ